MYDKIAPLFDENIHTRYLENITGQHPNKMFSMFKSETSHNDVLYSCERICINRVNGLICRRSDKATSRIVGFDIKAEDPRLFVFSNKVYIIFNRARNDALFPRCMAISEFDNWNPITLEIKDISKESRSKTEKNWSPFVKDGTLYFVYNLEPLTILTYDLNPNGECTMVNPQDSNKDPSDYIQETCIRGGSNLIPYQGDYYVGAFHSRVLDERITVYHTHIVILDTKHLDFKVVYISKPVAFRHEKPELFIAQGPYDWDEWYRVKFLREILLPLGRVPVNSHLCSISSPCSMYTKNGKTYITVNIQDSITLKYEIYINVTDLKENQSNVSENLNCFIKQSLDDLIAVFPIRTERKKTKVCCFV